MTGRRYYLTTLGDWQRQSARFANSHWLALTDAAGESAPVLALIEADEGVHLALEDDDAFEALPHPMSQLPISESAQAALARHGVAPGATTFDASEAIARLHPLLRHRIF
jgi:hypothetical protein